MGDLAKRGEIIKDMKYPLCEKALPGKRMKLLDFPEGYVECYLAETIESLLSSAPVVWAEEFNVVNVKNQYEKMGTWYHNKDAGCNDPGYRPPTHTARLLLIEEIKQEQEPEEIRLIREMLRDWEYGEDLLSPMNKARAFLAKRGEK